MQLENQFIHFQAALSKPQQIIYYNANAAKQYTVTPAIITYTAA